ncbi:hypothetical protein K503DRAFT_804448 [Rhizopogon vinicolor AM-OR11-026]|uniref:Uncharacterized protein n=1 Tax=Rhizopogon vinicolor AM-OR11-026 TaxID=1314800 RepID=A0A1B7ML60_9AGAM|nr:hypothetical protein K503DRAFT_804448 [Rhizopogon vinicolor AM-OR11-026]
MPNARDKIETCEERFYVCPQSSAGSHQLTSFSHLSPSCSGSLQELRDKAGSLRQRADAAQARASQATGSIDGFHGRPASLGTIADTYDITVYRMQRPQQHGYRHCRPGESID